MKDATARKTALDGIYRFARSTFAFLSLSRAVKF